MILSHYVSVIAIFLGIILLAAGVAKLRPVGFAATNRALRSVMPEAVRRKPLLVSTGLTLGLIMLELLGGLSLLFSRGHIAVVSSMVVLMLFLVFAFVRVVAVRKAIPCGCFGSIGLSTTRAAEVWQALALTSCAFTLVVVNVAHKPVGVVFSPVSVGMALLLGLLFFALPMQSRRRGMPERVSEEEDRTPFSSNVGGSRRGFLQLAASSLGGGLGYAVLGPTLPAIAKGDLDRVDDLGTSSPRPLQSSEVADVIARARRDTLTSRLERTHASFGQQLDWDAAFASEVTSKVAKFTVLAVPSHSGETGIVWIDGLSSGTHPGGVITGRGQKVAIFLDRDSSPLWTHYLSFLPTPNGPDCAVTASFICFGGSIVTALMCAHCVLSADVLMCVATAMVWIGSCYDAAKDCAGPAGPENDYSERGPIRRAAFRV